MGLFSCWRIPGTFSCLLISILTVCVCVCVFYTPPPASLPLKALSTPRTVASDPSLLESVLGENRGLEFCSDSVTNSVTMDGPFLSLFLGGAQEIIWKRGRLEDLSSVQRL